MKNLAEPTAHRIWSTKVPLAECSSLFVQFVQSVRLRLRSPFPCWLSMRSHSQILKAAHMPSQVALSIIKSAKAHQILLMLPISASLPLYLPPSLRVDSFTVLVWLGQAWPRPPPYLKVNWFETFITSAKYLHSSTQISVWFNNGEGMSTLRTRNLGGRGGGVKRKRAC